MKKRDHERASVRGDWQPVQVSALNDKASGESRCCRGRFKSARRALAGADGSRARGHRPAKKCQHAECYDRGTHATPSGPRGPWPTPALLSGRHIAAGRELLAFKCGSPALVPGGVLRSDRLGTGGCLPGAPLRRLLHEVLCRRVHWCRGVVAACPWPAGRAFPALSASTRPYPRRRHRVSHCGPTARNGHPTSVACQLVIEAAVAPESAGRAAASISVSGGERSGEGRPLHPGFRAISKTTKVDPQPGERQI